MAGYVFTDPLAREGSQEQLREWFQEEQALMEGADSVLAPGRTQTDWTFYTVTFNTPGACHVYAHLLAFVGGSPCRVDVELPMDPQWAREVRLHDEAREEGSGKWSVPGAVSGRFLHERHARDASLWFFANSSRFIAGDVLQLDADTFTKTGDGCVHQEKHPGT